MADQCHALLPASSASDDRCDIEATVRFAEETYTDKVFEQHLARRRVYLPEATCLCERHPQSGHLEVFPSNTRDKRFRRRRFRVRLSVWPALTPSLIREALG